MALRAGFFNAIKDVATGVYDKLYNADDYSNFISSFIRDGVRRGAVPTDVEGVSSSDLKVTVAGRTISVAAGKAIVLGKWVDNTSSYTFTETIELPPSGQSRKDRVCLLVDTVSDRDASFQYKKGTPTASTPVAPALTNIDTAKEICLAELLVTSGGTIEVTDTRDNYDLCGWITTPVGYDDYFLKFEEEFYEWFAGVKNKLVSATVFKEYTYREVLSVATSTVVFNIPQYDPTGVDIVHVYSNGIREVEGVDYTLEGSTITFLTTGGGTGTKIAGTEILVSVYKSIDGTGLGNVFDIVTEIQNKVNTLGDVSEYNYFCTGTADNVAISNICSAFLNGGDDYKQMKLNVYGTLGVTAAASGDGSMSRPFQYFNLGVTSASKTRKIIVNFANAERITINAEGTYATIFAGRDIFIENANVNVASGQYVTFLDGLCVDARDCEFYASATYDVIGCKNYGEIKDCKFSLASQLGNSFGCYCAEGTSGYGGFVRVYGGNFYNWTAGSGKESVCFYVVAGMTDNALVLNSVNCPQVTRSGYSQTDTVKINNGYASLNGCTLWKAPASYSSDTSKVSKNGVMVVSKPITSA